MPSEQEMREAIERTARQQVEHARKGGVTVSHDEMRNRIAAAVQRGDQKRQEKP